MMKQYRSSIQRDTLTMRAGGALLTAGSLRMVDLFGFALTVGLVMLTNDLAVGLAIDYTGY